MLISHLSLKNFRNIKDLKITFDKPMTILYGNNGQGKTNLIEAISYISTLSSFRNSKNDDVIKVGSDVGLIRCNTSKNFCRKTKYFYRKRADFGVFFLLLLSYVRNCDLKRIRNSADNNSLGIAKSAPKLGRYHSRY